MRGLIALPAFRGLWGTAAVPACYAFEHIEPLRKAVADARGFAAIKAAFVYSLHGWRHGAQNYIVGKPQ